MSELPGRPTMRLVRAVLELLADDVMVTISVAGLPNSIRVEEAVSTEGVLIVNKGPKTLYIRETAITAVEVIAPNDMPANISD